MFSTKLRTITAASLLSVTALVGVGTGASAAEGTKVPSCIGASEHKQAQSLRLQALALDLTALQARLADATAKNKPEVVTRINARVAKLNARLAQVHANQAKLTAKCP